jgi:hypothetical protein
MSGGTVSFQQWFSKSSAMVLSLARFDPAKEGAYRGSRQRQSFT